MTQVERLEKLGFKKATKKIVESRDMYKKLHIAYQHYDFVTPEDVEKFKSALRARTEKDSKTSLAYDTLAFIEVKDYQEAPPAEVLDKMAEAIERECFDTFEIAKIESVKEVKDPILFGKVKECGDYFFICQWDSDVTIEMIKAEAEKK